MALSNFTPSAFGVLACPSPAPMAVAPFTVGTSANVAIPGGGGPTLVVTNVGPYPAVVLLGGSTVTVTPATGIAVGVNQSVALAVGSDGYIAGLGVGGGPAILNLAQGT